MNNPPPSRLIGFIGLILFQFSSHAQLPTELMTIERGKMLQGVATIPKTGAPGPIAIWGTMAFPILSAPDKDGVEIPVAAAAGFANGRLILFGHNSYLDGSAGGDHAQLIENCVKWVGTKDQPRLGLKGVKSEIFQSRGFAPKSFDSVDAKTLSDFDVVVVNIQNVTSPEAGAALATFIKNGGGVIAGMTGWAFPQTSGGKELTLAHQVNQALMPAGLAITDLSAFNNVLSFEARVDLPSLINAAAAITAIKSQRDGSPPLEPTALQQATSAIQIALAAHPPDRSSLRDAVMTALGTAGDSAAPFPTKESPLTASKDHAARLRLGMETRVLRLAASETVTAHPAHTSFPGKAPADAPRITQTITLVPTIPGWTSTGLYAAAGETITIAVPTEVAEAGYAVRIGSHSDTLYHLDTWSRAPDITKSLPLSAAMTKAASAFGGLIYIEVPSRPKDESPFSVTISGAIPAPFFVLGQHDDATWNSDLKNRPAPWAELACDKMIVTLPSEVARTVNNPTELMTFWKKQVEAQDDISNQTLERKRPERMVADVQISAGFMHSGYPIMLHLPQALEMVTLNRIKFPGWGFHHEVGHNHQRGDFTFEGTGEVTNNVLAMYVYHEVLKKDWLIGHPNITEEARKQHIAKIKSTTDKWQLWKSDPFVALTTYIQLVQTFGWESWRQYLYSFADPNFGPPPANDDAKRDQFLVRYSKITQKNLAPFFDFWGIPISAGARAEVTSFEPWLPTEL
jgi:hypothetical protein